MAKASSVTSFRISASIDPLDALIVGYYEVDKLMYTAKVRNDFMPHLRREIMKRLKGMKIEPCPLPNLPEKKRTQMSIDS